MISFTDPSLHGSSVTLVLRVVNWSICVLSSCSLHIYFIIFIGDIKTASKSTFNFLQLGKQRAALFIGNVLFYVMSVIDIPCVSYNL